MGTDWVTTANWVVFHHWGTHYHSCIIADSFLPCHLIKYGIVQLIFSAKNIALLSQCSSPFLVPTLSTTELLEQDSALFWLGEFLALDSFRLFFCYSDIIILTEGKRSWGWFVRHSLMVRSFPSFPHGPTFLSKRLVPNLKWTIENGLPI